MKMNNCPEGVRPRLQVLNEEHIMEIHKYSIRILESTGIKVKSKTALQIFRNSNAVRIDNDIVYISEELINDSIKIAPSNVEIFNRTGNSSFHLGKQQGTETYFGIGVTNPYFQDIESNHIENFTRKHMMASARLGDMLHNYDMVSTIGIPSDVAGKEIDYYSALDMYANTEKSQVLLISGKKSINRVFDLLSFLHGDITKKPFCILYVNPITPLVLNESTTDKIIASINNDLPVMFSNYGMYGGTSPATEGGTLALLNAELLAGLVFGQLVREGAKMILGSLPAAFNMKTMGSSYYTSTSYLLNLACAEMMDYYGIPHCGTSGSSKAWGADLISSANLWQNHLSSIIGKVGCAPFVGGSFDSLAFSPANVVLSDYIIGEARRFAKGFKIDDTTIDLKEIHEIGHGGNYLTTNQTLFNLSYKNNDESLWPYLSLESWIEQGFPKAENILLERTKDLYNKAMIQSESQEEIIEKGEQYIKNKIH